MFLKEATSPDYQEAHVIHLFMPWKLSSMMPKLTTNPSSYFSKTFQRPSTPSIQTCLEQQCSDLKSLPVLSTLPSTSFLIVSILLSRLMAIPSHTKFRLVLIRARLFLPFYGSSISIPYSLY